LNISRKDRRELALHMLIDHRHFLAGHSLWQAVITVDRRSGAGRQCAGLPPSRGQQAMRRHRHSSADGKPGVR
jgi:hypothetical protein